MGHGMAHVRSKLPLPPSWQRWGARRFSTHLRGDFALLAPRDFTQVGGSFVRPMHPTKLGAAVDPSAFLRVVGGLGLGFPVALDGQAVALNPARHQEVLHGMSAVHTERQVVLGITNVVGVTVHVQLQFWTTFQVVGEGTKDDQSTLAQHTLLGGELNILQFKRRLCDGPVGWGNRL